MKESIQNHHKESSIRLQSLFTCHISIEQGTKRRNGKIIDFPSEKNTFTNPVMAESNTNDSDTNDMSETSSQITELMDNYEKKIGELQSEFSQLKDLMMAVIRKSNEDSPSSSTQGLSKQSRMRSDSYKDHLDQFDKL